MRTFTIEEFRNYVMSQDSLGDVVFNLNEKNIIKANTPVEDETEEDVDYLDKYADEYETLERIKDSEFDINE